MKDEEQQTSVEELLAFIEGGDGEDGDQPMASKLSKRQRKKLKKVSWQSLPQQNYLDLLSESTRKA